MRYTKRATIGTVQSRGHGIALPYLLIMLTTLTAFASLGVDWAHVVVVKNELRASADSAARGSGVATGQREVGDGFSSAGDGVVEPG